MGAGLCTKPGVINHGRNSGYQAIGLAYQMGAARIVLLGYDMQHTGGKRHWFGDHPKSLTNADGIENWRHGFKALAKHLHDDGIEVINASPETALECFKRQPLETIV